MKILMLFLEIIKFYLIFRYGTNIGKHKNSMLYLFLVIINLGVYAYIVTNIVEENMISYLIFIFMELMLLFDYFFYKILLLEIVVVALIGSMDSLSLIGFKMINIIFHFQWKEEIENVLGNMGTIVFLIILYYAIWKNQKISLFEVGFLPLFYIFMIGVIYSFLLVFIGNAIAVEEYLETNIKIYIAYFLMIIGAYFQMGILLRLVVLNHKLKQKDTINQHYLQLQEKQYQYLQNKEQETRKIRHDMKQHIFIMMQYCKDKNIEELERYIAQIWGHIERISFGYCVNHSIIDALLNQYAYMCKENGIQLKVTGHFPELCEVSSYDLCVVFSNLIENAYEAALDCHNKFIDITLRFDEQMIYIQEKNSYKGEIKTKNGKIITKKSDTSSHGFGIENIRESVKKYKGNFEFRREKIENETVVIVQIMIQNRRENL